MRHGVFEVFITKRESSSSRGRKDKLIKLWLINVKELVDTSGLDDQNSLFDE